MLAPEFFPHLVDRAADLLVDVLLAAGVPLDEARVALFEPTVFLLDEQHLPGAVDDDEGNLAELRPAAVLPRPVHAVKHGVVVGQALSQPLEGRELSAMRAAERSRRDVAGMNMGQRLLLPPPFGYRCRQESTKRPVAPRDYRRVPMNSVCLVSWVSRKRPGPASAKDLYTSDWFRKASAYVAATGMPWFILSAEHGLLDPGPVGAPYEKTLDKMGVAERRRWADRVIARTDRDLLQAARIVVRVGTHALTTSSRTTRWNRLSGHRGVVSTGAGNHRASIFRRFAGKAAMARDANDEPASWGIGSDPGAAARRLDWTRDHVKVREIELERAVSEHIRATPFLWIDIDDRTGADSLRGFVERNAIALLSNFEK